jgi:hypothetical protein
MHHSFDHADAKQEQPSHARNETTKHQVSASKAVARQPFNGATNPNTQVRTPTAIATLTTPMQPGGATRGADPRTRKSKPAWRPKRTILKAFTADARRLERDRRTVKVRSSSSPTSPSNPLASRNRPVKRETACTTSSTGSPPIHPAAPTRAGGSAEPANCAQRFVGPARSSAHKSTYATSNHLVQPGGYVTPLAQSSPWALRIEVTEEERAPLRSSSLTQGGSKTRPRPSVPKLLWIGVGGQNHRRRGPVALAPSGLRKPDQPRVERSDTPCRTPRPRESPTQAPRVPHPDTPNSTTAFGSRLRRIQVTGAKGPHPERHQHSSPLC